MGTQPTINRSVHYLSLGDAEGKYPRQCRAAIVTAVNDELKGDERVSLFVMTPNGTFNETDLKQDETKTQGGTWHWACVRSDSGGE